MNCNPGDLAIIVRCMAPEAVGKIVTCARFDPHPTQGPAWRIDPPGHAAIVLDGSFYPGDWVCDENLRPLRDNDGEDETLTWAGKPESITTPEAV